MSDGLARFDGFPPRCPRAKSTDGVRTLATSRRSRTERPRIRSLGFERALSHTDTSERSRRSENVVYLHRCIQAVPSFGSSRIVALIVLRIYSATLFGHVVASSSALAPYGALAESLTADVFRDWFK